MPHCSFLELPPEIRKKIYRYLLVRPTPMYRNPSRTTAPPAKIGQCGSGIVYEARIYARDPRRADDWKNDSYQTHRVPDLAILTVSRQIYAEAAYALYSENSFEFWQGVRPHRCCQEHVWDLVDDIASVNRNYLMSIRTMRLNVRIFDSPWSLSLAVYNSARKWPDPYTRSSFLAVQDQLRTFADKVREKHSIHKLNVSYCGYICTQPRQLDRLQNVLEPLSSIYGIDMAIVFGVTEEFGVKMGKAMTAKSLAVEKVPDTYGTRRAKGKRTKLLYKLKPYYKSKYDFHLKDVIEASGEQDPGH